MYYQGVRNEVILGRRQIVGRFSVDIIEGKIDGDRCY